MATQRKRPTIAITINADLLVEAKRRAEARKLPLSRWLDQLVLDELERNPSPGVAKATRRVAKRQVG